MTGCVAVLSLAMGGVRTSWAEDAGEDKTASRGTWQASRFGLAETMQRIESCAQQHGLGVLVRWTPSDTSSVREIPAARQPRGTTHSDPVQRDGAVLVFESLSGGTPVVMDGDAAPGLPLSLCLRSRADGRVEVLLPPQASAYAGELPEAVAREMTELPVLVADALSR